MSVELLVPVTAFIMFMYSWRFAKLTSTSSDVEPFVANWQQTHKHASCTYDLIVRITCNFKCYVLLRFCYQWIRFDPQINFISYSIMCVKSKYDVFVLKVGWLQQLTPSLSQCCVFDSDRLTLTVLLCEQSTVLLASRQDLAHLKTSASHYRQEEHDSHYQ